MIISKEIGFLNFSLYFTVTATKYFFLSVGSINASLVNQPVGGNLLGNDILRQIELLKLQGQR